MDLKFEVKIEKCRNLTLKFAKQNLKLTFKIQTRLE